MGALSECAIGWLETLFRLDELPRDDTGTNSCALISCMERFESEVASEASFGIRVACSGRKKPMLELTSAPVASVPR